MRQTSSSFRKRYGGLSKPAVVIKKPDENPTATARNIAAEARANTKI